LGRLIIAFPKDGDIWSGMWDGTQWSDFIDVSRDSHGTSFWPRMTISNGNTLHLVWYSGYPGLELFDIYDRMSRGEYEIYSAMRILNAPRLAGTPYSVSMDIDTQGGASELPTPTVIQHETAALDVSQRNEKIAFSTEKSPVQSFLFPILFAIFPVVLLILILMIWKFSGFSLR